MASREETEVAELLVRLAAYEALAANVALLLEFINLAALVDFSNSNASGLVAAC
jgi:hypothetical protein